MIVVRHRSASTSEDYWTYRRGYVEAAVRRGSTLVHLWIAVCSPARHVFGAAPITRVDNDSWLILPSRFERTWPRGIETMTDSPCPIGDHLDPGQQLALTQTPESVSEELEKL